MLGGVVGLGACWSLQYFFYFGHKTPEARESAVQSCVWMGAGAKKVAHQR